AVRARHERHHAARLGTVDDRDLNDRAGIAARRDNQRTVGALTTLRGRRSDGDRGVRIGVLRGETRRERRRENGRERNRRDQQIASHTPFSSRSFMNSAGCEMLSRRSGTSVSFENCAILPSTGRYWLETSSGGATMRKKKNTGFSSIALKSTPSRFRPNATRSLLTTSERQWGIAMPPPMPVEPTFSRRLSILKSIASFFSSRPRSAMSSFRTSSLVVPCRSSLTASSEKNSRSSMQFLGSQARTGHAP